MNERQDKSIVTAYVLWLLIGVIGGHRFYLRKPGGGVMIILLGVAGAAVLYYGIIENTDEMKWTGYGLLGLWAIWLIADAVMMPVWLENANAIPESERQSMAHRDVDLDPSPLAFARKHGIKPKTDKPRGIPDDYVLPWRREGTKQSPHPYDDVPDDGDTAGWLDDKEHRKPEGKG